MSTLRQFLKDVAIPSSLAETAHLALALTDDGESVVVSQAEGTLQSSKEFAKVYKLRRSIGYFKNAKITGLDESIALLDLADRLVWLSYTQTERALISIWIEESGSSICGLMVMELM